MLQNISFNIDRRYRKMMHQTFLLLFMLGMALPAFSQKKLSLGLNTNFEINFLTRSGSPVLSAIEEKNGPGLGYAIGFQAQWRASSKVFLRSGLNLRRDQYRYTLEGLKFATDIHNWTVSRLQNDFTVSTLSIPVDFGMVLQSRNKKVGYPIGFGTLIPVLEDTQTESAIHEGIMVYETQAGAVNKVYDSIYMLGLFGGMERRLGKNFTLGIELNFRCTPHKVRMRSENDDPSDLIETGITMRARW